MGTLSNCRGCGNVHEVEDTPLNNPNDIAEDVVSGLLLNVPHIRGTYGGWYYHVRTTEMESSSRSSIRSI